MGQYALALSAVLKAQYNPSKCLVGGADGVADLDAYIDFNSTLVLTNSSLEDLKNASTTASPGNLATPKESLTVRGGGGGSRVQGGEVPGGWGLASHSPSIGSDPPPALRLRSRGRRWPSGAAWASPASTSAWTPRT